MRIKELHIRNIASIEQADIDFEKDLNESYTNQPAPVFLIAGDTGAGKSVLLDAIALALYKTSPRIENLPNANKNKFVNTAGENVSVASIEQYTRMGIGPNEESSCSVVFEGNDGIEYTASLQLGLHKGNKGAGLKYRKAQWSLAFNGHQYEKVDDIRARIEQAVGMNFEQFSRMAMLAQGQFAAFLTGEKSERETILEKLTNTERFSLYGEAISRLQKRYKQEKDSLQKVYETENGHIKSDEEMSILRQEKENLEIRKRQFVEQIEGLDAKLNCLNLIEEQHQVTALAQKSLGELRDTSALEAEYGRLAGDLSARKQALKNLQEAIDADNKILEQDNGKADLYTKAGEHLLQLGHYGQYQTELDKLQLDRQNAEAQTPQLKKQLDEAEALVEKARRDQLDIEKKIEDKTRERNALQPDQTNRRLEALRNEKTALLQLQADIRQYAESENELRQLQADIAADEKLLEGLLATLTDKQARFEQADQAYEAAAARWNTMNSSLDEAMSALRRRLASEHASTCPLCGQAIAHQLPGAEEFKAAISPLEEEKERCKSVRSQAEKERTEAQSAYDKSKGSLVLKRANATRQKTTLNETGQTLKQTGVQWGLDPARPYAAQIENQLQRNADETSNLTQNAEQAFKLQQEIDRLQEDKKPLDTNLNNAQRHLQQAGTDLENNKTALENNQRRTAETKAKLEEVDKQLTGVLGGAYPDWQADLEATKCRLQAEANAYSAVKQRRDDNSTKLQKDQVLADSLDNLQGLVLGKTDEWQADYPPAALESNDIGGRWNLLLNALDQHNTNVKRQQTIIEQAKETIDKALEKLGVAREEDCPPKAGLETEKQGLTAAKDELAERLGSIQSQLDENNRNQAKAEKALADLECARKTLCKWELVNNYFGGTRFRTLVQSYILQPLLQNANIFLRQITDRYRLTCSRENEQLSILVLDNDHKGQVRSATLLSGGERFMISLALSLALSSLNRPDFNTDILFIDEGFGTLDEKNLDSVMATLEKLQGIAGMQRRRVGIISHRAELIERIPVQIEVQKKGEGRSKVVIRNG